MRALTHPGSGQLVLADRPDPVPAEGQILVRVHAAGLNRADLLQRAGKYPAPAGWPVDIPGLEYAGEVIGRGPGAVRWNVGDRVMGLVGGGAQAELLVVHQDEAIAVPAEMSWDDAAAIPEAFLTAWDAMVHQGAAQRGEQVLFHAIGSGVGTAAAQLAPWLGFTLTGTSRTPEKLQRAQALGMQHGVLTTNPDWPTKVAAPIDVLIDTLGADALRQNLELLAPRGRLVVLGTLTGAQASGINLGLVLRKRLHIVGTAMRSRSHAERCALAAQFSEDVLSGFAAGDLKPVIEALIPMAEVARAHDLMAGNQTFGKIVLSWDA